MKKTGLFYSGLLKTVRIISWKLGIIGFLSSASASASYSYFGFVILRRNVLYAFSKKSCLWGILAVRESSRFLEFIRYYCEKYIWFSRICWRLSCLINIKMRRGVFYYVRISSPRIKGWSKIFIFKARS